MNNKNHCNNNTNINNSCKNELTHTHTNVDLV